MPSALPRPSSSAAAAAAAAAVDDDPDPDGGGGGASTAPTSPPASSSTSTSTAKTSTPPARFVGAFERVLGEAADAFDRRPHPPPSQRYNWHPHHHPNRRRHPAQPQSNLRHPPAHSPSQSYSHSSSRTSPTLNPLPTGAAGTAAAASSAAAPASASLPAAASPCPALSPRPAARSPTESDHSATASATAGSSVPLADQYSPLPTAALDLPPVPAPVPASSTISAALRHPLASAAAGPHADKVAEAVPSFQGVDACDIEQAAQDAEIASLFVSGSTGEHSAISLFALKSPPVIALPHLYLNHAPGLQRVCFFNASPHTSIRLRLSSDLGDAVSFMRSMHATPSQGLRSGSEACHETTLPLNVSPQRSAPGQHALPALDTISWATNSLNWAQNDGLSPTKLALLREISASLSELRDDGIVLAPQQRDELFVLFRPKRFLSQHERSQRSGRRRSGGAAVASVAEAGTSVVACGSNTEPPISDSQLLATGPQVVSSGSHSSSIWSGESPSALAPDVPLLVGNMDRESGGAEVGKTTYPAQHVHHEIYVRGTVTVIGTSLLPSGLDGVVESAALPLRASFVKPHIRLAPDLDHQQKCAPRNSQIGGAQAPTSTRPSGPEPAGNATGSNSVSSSSSSGHGSSSLTLDLGACHAGESVEMSFVIQNVSQIACCVQAKLEPGEGNLSALPNPVRLLDGPSRSCTNTDCISSVLRMVDDDDDDQSSTSDTRAFYPIWTPPFTSRQVTVHLSPQLAHAQAGSAFRRTITITNLHDTSNTTYLHLRASILAPPPPDDPLVVLPAGDLAAMPPVGLGAPLPAPGTSTSTTTSESAASSASGSLSRSASTSSTAPVLDMGDMVGGRWARQLLLLVNTSAHNTLDIDLSATPGYEVTFERARLAPPETVLPHSAPGATMVSLSRAGSLAASTVNWADAGSSRRDHSLALASDNQLPISAAMSSRSVSEGSPGPDLDTEETPAMHALRTPVPSGGQNGLLTIGGRHGPLETPPPLNLGSVVSPDDMVLSPLSYMALASASHRAEDQDADSNASEAGSLDSNRLHTTDLQSVASSLRSPPSAQSTWASAGASRPVTPRSLQRSLSRYPSKSSLAASKADDGSTWSETTSNSVDSRRSAHLPPTTISASSHRSGAGMLPSLGANSSTSLLGRGTPTAGALSSSAGSALATASRQASAGGARTDPLPTTPDAPHMTRVSLLPLTEARILVGFRPTKGSVDPTFSAGKLKQIAFNLFVDTRLVGGSATVRRTVQVKARTCTSFITITPKVCDFGETSVGARKTGTLHVRNESQLTARVEVRFVSKVLSMYRDEVPIAPGQTVVLKLDFFPRRVNNKYRKQLTVTNLLNRENDQIFEVRSRNTDTQRISLHSLYYRILTPSGANFIDFGDVYINSPAVRSFTIENTSPAPLTLEVSPAQPEDLGLYVSPPAGRAPAKSTPPSASLAVPPDKPLANKSGTIQDEKPEKKESAPAEGHTTPPAAPRDEQGNGNDQAFADAGLKERFLETLSTDSPTSIRKENASWRLAQKHAHTKRRLRKDTSPSPSSSKSKDAPLGEATGKQSKVDAASTGASAGMGGNGLSKPRSQANILASSARGGRGNKSVTMRYQSATTFKDKLALRGLEPLDLASGPPVSSHRISPKSKMYQQLDQMAVPSAPNPSGSSASPPGSKGEADFSTSGDGPSPSEEHLRPPRALFSSCARTPSPAFTDGANDGASGINSSPISALGATSTTAACPPPPTTVAMDEKSDKDSKRRRAPALTGQQARAPKLADFTDVSKLTVEQVLSALEAQASKLHAIYFGSPDREERAVRTEINLYRRLSRVLSSPDQLCRLDTLTLQPGEQVKVWCVYRPNGSTRPHIQGNARKQDSRIYLRLLRFDKSLLSSSGSPDLAPLAQLDPEELPVRELMLRAVTCRSLMELGQPHINFGTLDPGEIKVRKIVVHNRAEWPLRYCIRKSGSIASGDIRLAHGGRFGIVPGYGHRAVEFGFSPTMSGVVNERLVLENVADRDNDQTVVVKAHIRKVPNFSVAPAVLSLGAVTGDKLSPPAFFQINNISSKSRSFTVDVDRAALQGHRCVAEVGMVLAPADPVQQPQARTQAEEEEIEHAAQKLKIAIRKGQEDKIAKYKDKLKQLGVGLDVAGIGIVGEEGEEPKEEEVASTSALAPGAQLKRSPSSAVTLSLDAGRTARIAVWVRVRRTHTVLGQAEAEAHTLGDGLENDSTGEDLTLLVRIHETKNADVTKTVQLRLHAVLIASPSLQPQAHPSTSNSQRRRSSPSAPGSYPLTPSVDGLEAEAKQLAIPGSGQEHDQPMPPQAAIFTSHM